MVDSVEMAVSVDGKTKALPSWEKSPNTCTDNVTMTTTAVIFGPGIPDMTPAGMLV